MDERRELIDLLLADARQSTEDLARQTGLSAGAVEEHLADLEASGVVRGYQAVVDWSNVEGEEHVQAEVELNVELDRETRYDDIAHRITGFPQVTSLKLISGDYDFAIDVEGKSYQNVATFVSEEIAPIPEVTQTVTHFVMETYKDRGVEFDDGDDDDRLSVSP